MEKRSSALASSNEEEKGNPASSKTGCRCEVNTSEVFEDLEKLSGGALQEIKKSNADSEVRSSISTLECK